MEQILSQDEVDALLKGISGGEIEEPEERLEEEELEDKGYDLLYLEVPEGHSWGQWRSQIDDLLVTFFGATG